MPTTSRQLLDNANGCQLGLQPKLLPGQAEETWLVWFLSPTFSSAAETQGEKTVLQSRSIPSSQSSKLHCAEFTSWLKLHPICTFHLFLWLCLCLFASSNTDSLDLFAQKDVLFCPFIQITTVCKIPNRLLLQTKNQPSAMSKVKVHYWKITNTETTRKANQPVPVKKINTIMKIHVILANTVRRLKCPLSTCSLIAQTLF